jgi:hypothetical protein
MYSNMMYTVGFLAVLISFLTLAQIAGFEMTDKGCDSKPGIKAGGL